MSEDIKEQLSALMDGELSRDERAFLLRRLDHDAGLRATWTRFHLQRDVLTHRAGGVRSDLADRVMSALDNEPSLPNSQRAVVGQPARWRPWLGAAIAASVAFVAVLSVSPQNALRSGPAMAELVPGPRLALPAGVPGPIAPSLSGMSSGVQAVSAERSQIIDGAVGAISAEQLMLLRHGQISGGTWQVGGGTHAYSVDAKAVAIKAAAESSR